MLEETKLHGKHRSPRHQLGRGERPLPVPRIIFVIPTLQSRQLHARDVHGRVPLQRVQRVGRDVGVRARLRERAFSRLLRLRLLSPSPPPPSSPPRLVRNDLHPTRPLPRRLVRLRVKIIKRIALRVVRLHPPRRPRLAPVPSPRSSPPRPSSGTITAATVHASSASSSPVARARHFSRLRRRVLAARRVRRALSSNSSYSSLDPGKLISPSPRRRRRRRRRIVAATSFSVARSDAARAPAIARARFASPSSSRAIASRTPSLARRASPASRARARRRRARRVARRRRRARARAPRAVDVRIRGAFVLTADASRRRARRTPRRARRRADDATADADDDAVARGRPRRATTTRGAAKTRARTRGFPIGRRTRDASTRARRARGTRDGVRVR